MMKLIPPVTALISLSVLVVPAAGQLNPTTWEESLSFDLAPDPSFFESGDSTAVPEPLSTSLSGSNYTFSGSISFQQSDAPNVTTEVAGNYQNGLTALGGTAYCRIEFEFWVRETSPPPVAVSMVPVDISASGTVNVTGDGSLYASGFSSFNVATDLGPVINDEVFVENTSSPPSDIFFLNQQLGLSPDQVAFGDMSATAAIAAFEVQDGLFATAFAYIDPVIQVADEIIPGSSANYRDHYEVEFGSGYNALGSTPVRKTTWGRIKSLYGN